MPVQARSCSFMAFSRASAITDMYVCYIWSISILKCDVSTYLHIYKSSRYLVGVPLHIGGDLINDVLYLLPNNTDNYVLT